MFAAQHESSAIEACAVVGLWLYFDGGSRSHFLMQVAALQSLHAKLTTALSSIHESAAPLYLEPLPRTNRGRTEALLKASHEAVDSASTGVLQVGK